MFLSGNRVKVLLRQFGQYTLATLLVLTYLFKYSESYYLEEIIGWVYYSSFKDTILKVSDFIVHG
jgi:hypothetical protein